MEKVDPTYIKIAPTYLKVARTYLKGKTFKIFSDTKGTLEKLHKKYPHL